MYVHPYTFRLFLPLQCMRRCGLPTRSGGAGSCGKNRKFFIKHLIVDEINQSDVQKADSMLEWITKIINDSILT